MSNLALALLVCLRSGILSLIPAILPSMFTTIWRNTHTVNKEVISFEIFRLNPGYNPNTCNTSENLSESRGHDALPINLIKYDTGTLTLARIRLSVPKLTTNKYFLMLTNFSHSLITTINYVLGELDKYLRTSIPCVESQSRI